MCASFFHVCILCVSNEEMQTSLCGKNVYYARDCVHKNGRSIDEAIEWGSENILFP